MSEEVVNLINIAANTDKLANNLFMLSIILGIFTLVSAFILSLVNKKLNKIDLDKYAKKKEEAEAIEKEMDIYESELDKQYLDEEKEKLDSLKNELKTIDKKVSKRDSLPSRTALLVYSLAIFLLLMFAYKYSDATRHLDEANSLLKNDSKIVAQENEYVIKRYYSVGRENDYGLNLQLKILNLTDKNITNATVVEKNSGVKYENVDLQPFEYVEIEFAQNIDYTDDFNFEIVK